MDALGNKKVILLVLGVWCVLLHCSLFIESSLCFVGCLGYFQTLFCDKLLVQSMHVT